MTIKDFIISTLLFSLPIISYCQIQLSGTVTDSAKEPLFGVNIILISLTDGTVSAGAITNEEGVFQFSDVKKGLYRIEFSYLGFATENREINLQKNTQLDDISIKDGENQLDEILIVSEKKIIELKADRTIFNISKSDAAIGGNAIDALKVTPGLKINDEKIEMAGKGSVKLMIDNREVRLEGKGAFEYLKSIPSDQIDRIEMISNPPAKYSAEGSFGLLNVVLKKGVKDQFYGIVSGKLSQSRRLSNTENISIFYHKNGLQINGGTHYFDDRGKVTNFEQAEYSTYTLKEDLILDRKIQGYGGFFELEYALSEQTLIGVNLRYSRTPNSQVRRENHSDYIRDSQIDSTWTTNSRDKTVFEVQNYNLYLDHKLDTIGSKFSGEFSFIQHQQDKDNESISKNSSTQEVFDLSSSNIPRTRLLYIGLDTELKRDFADYNFGIQANSSETKNQSEYKSPDLADQNNKFKYNEDKFSAYISASKTFDEQWSLTLGLRSEYTLSKGNSITLQEITKRKDWEFFPNFYLNYNANEKNSFTLTYGRRINRPPFNFLDPFRSYQSPYSYLEGNPYLRPAYNNNFELKHLYKNKLGTSLYFSYIPNNYDYLEIISEDSPAFATLYDNYLKVYKFGLTETYYWQPFKWWESNNTANVYYSISKSMNPNTESEIKGFGAYLATGNTLTLNQNKTLRANLNFTYYSPGINGMEHDKTFYTLNVGVTALFFSEKLTLSLQAQDILETGIYKSTSKINGIPYYFEANYDSRSISLSASYKFGNAKNQKQREVNDVNENRI